MSLKFLLNIQVKIFNRRVGWKYKCESHQQESEGRQKWQERECEYGYKNSEAQINEMNCRIVQIHIDWRSSRPADPGKRF